MQRTPNLGLPQFEPSDKYRLEDYNEAYMKIDEKVKELNDKEAQLDTKLAEAQSIIDTWETFKNTGGVISNFLNVDSNYQELKLQKNNKTLMNKIDDTKGGFIGYFSNSGVEKSSITFNNNNEIDLKTQGINLTSPLYIKEGLSRNEPNTSEYSRIVRAATDITKGSFKIQLGTGGGGFEVVNSGWDNCLFSVNEEDGVQISSIDGGSRLKIDGRLIESINDALALKAPGTDPLYYIRDTKNNVDVLMPGGTGDIGSPNQSWNNIYVGNYSRGTNGYTKLSNGFILQWGRFTVNCGYQMSIKTDITLPITFPTRALFQSAICSWNMSVHSYDWTSAILNSATSIGTNMLRIETRGIASGMPEHIFEINYFIVGY